MATTIQEDEEQLALDLALALSLSEADADHTRISEDTSADEALARKLQQEFNQEASQLPTQPSSARPYQPPPPPMSDNRTPAIGQQPGGPPTIATNSNTSNNSCARCGKSLLSLGGLFRASVSYITALGQTWHPDCFTCAACHLPLNTASDNSSQFMVGKEDNQPYHPACYKQLFHPRCQVCRDHLPTDVDGRIRWTEVPFWRQKACMKHTNDGTKRCTGCTRMQPSVSDWIELEDGRVLCLDCVDSMIIDTDACQPLYDDILAFYAHKRMPLPARPPLLLVESQALNTAESQETGGRGRGDGPVFHTRGLCLTEYRTTTTIRSVVRKSPLLGSVGLLFSGVSQSDVQLTAPSSTSKKTECSVTAILVLYGLPRLLTGCILTHECMHAWLRLSGYHRLAPEIEEGLCQLMALLWLEAQAGLVGYEERLAAFFGNQIRTDPSLVYGEGLRAALEAFQRFGLESVLATVKRTGSLPC